jgi:NitT/TauT family transport system permease protein
MSRLAPFFLIAILLAGWEIACRVMQVPVYFLPPPSAVALALSEHWPALVAASWRTLSVALISLVLASLIAQALAILTALSPLLDRAIRPLASVVQVTPVVAIAPLVLIWAGLDHPERALVTLAVLVAFFPIFSGATAGLRSADPDLERLFALSGGVRGLAWQILDAGNKLQTDRMIAALVVLGAMGVALHAALEAIERAGLRWWRGR